MRASNFVRSYFDVRWWRSGTTAAQAFDAGKTIAIAVLQRRLAEVEALTFEEFAAQCCHSSVTAESVHGGRDDV